MTQATSSRSQFQIWFTAVRPWSYTAAFVPITLGAALAKVHGQFHLGLYLLTLAAGVLIQAGTNMINTYCDYVSGVDTVQTASKRSPLVRQEIAPKVMHITALAAFAGAGLIGLWLTYLCGWPVLVCGVIGMIGGFCYTAGFKPYKYQGLGTPLVFFLMGPLMAWPSYYIQTHTFSWLPIWISLPIGFLVSNILHANEIRDHEADRLAGVLTFSQRLGYARSIKFFYFLNIAAYISLAGLVILGGAKLAALLPLIILPYVVKVCLQLKAGASGQKEKLLWLMVAAGNIHMLFGVLLACGILIN